jgi:hypothetical protein
VTRVRARYLAAACGVLAVALAAPWGDARAGGAPRIVILAPDPDDRVSLRLQAELRALRFQVPDVEIAPEPPSRARLEEAARKSDAVAAVRIVPSSAGVEVWIVDRITGKTVLREMVTDDARSPAGVATVALRVVELLRASLMELDAPHPPHGEVQAPPLIRALMAPASPAEAAPPVEIPPAAAPAFAVELGPALLLSPGGLSPAGNLDAAIHFRPFGGLGASVVALIPIVPAVVSGPEGRTTARIGLLGPAFRWVFASPGSAWAPAAGAGIALIWLHLDGVPAAGYAGSSADLVTFAAFGRFGLGYAVHPRLRIRVDALGGMVNARPVVQFGDRVAATWGTPFVMPTLGLELDWP